MRKSSVDTLGVVESRSIAAGVLLADGMVKAAPVELLRASPICSGRYMIHISGDRQAVGAAVAFAEHSGRALAGSFVISNVSPQLLAALKKPASAVSGDALGIVECRTASAGIAAADSAVKRSDVRLLRLVIGQGINGKSFFVLGGDVAAVEEASEAAKTVLGAQLIESVVIPRPDDAVVLAVISSVR